MMQTHLPKLEQKPWLAKPVKGALRQLLHEQEFIAFAKRYPHLQGIEFVEQVLNYFNFAYAVRDNEVERIPSTRPGGNYCQSPYRFFRRISFD